MYSHPDYRFKNQRENEHILKIIHRHWFNILIQFLVVFVVIVLIFGSWILLTVSFPQLAEIAGPHTLAFIETTALIFIWLYGFLLWVDYYLDVWIITNERIVNIEQKGLFLRESSDLQLMRIQDVTTHVVGLIPTILNYGDVYVQTAGEIERFVLRQVPDPYGLKSLIMAQCRTINEPPKKVV